MTSSGPGSPQASGGAASAPAPKGLFAFPVSPAQKRIWYLEELRPGTPVHHLTFAVRLKGPLDPALLELAINQVVRRHEILRTRFELHDQQPVQVVGPALTVPLGVTDLAAVPAAERPEQALQAATDEARRPFHPTRLPLLRPHLVRLSAEEHLFSLAAHELVFDRWSVPLFMRELAVIYELFRAGKPLDLPEPPIQFADFAVWQRERMATADKDLAWWKRRLSRRVPPLALAGDRPRRPVQTWRGSVETLALPAALRTPLQELGQREDAPLFITLLAAFETLLLRYSGQEEMLVGSPVAGRNRTETEDLIGPFANTLVLRADLSGDPAFREYVRRLRETVVHAYAHGETPFEQLIEDLRPERSLGHSPLLQVTFALERPPLERVHWPSLSLEDLALDTGTSRSDLALRIVDGPGGLTARMEYSLDLFDPQTVRRMLDHYGVLLEEIAADPGRRLSRLPLLTAAEQHQLSPDWNRVQVGYPSPAGVHEQVEARATRSPDAVAATYGQTNLTYRELDQQSNQLARHLHQLGVTPQAPVALCLDRSPELLLGLLAVLKAGGTFVILDPADPACRRAFLLEDSGAQWVLTRQCQGHAFPKGGPALLCLDSETTAIGRRSRGRLSVRVQPRDLAGILYAPDTAGTPKGILMPHRALRNLFHSLAREPGLSDADIVPAISPVSLDRALLELLFPLTVGARVVLATAEETADGAQLMARIHSAAVTTLPGTPATWRLLLRSGWRGNRALRLLSIGEPLSRAQAGQLLDRCAELWNLYGPVEAAGCAAVARIEPGSDPVTLGRPIANTGLYIVDRHLQPVPIGVPGELVIGGDALALGYWRRADIAAERFLHDPFSDDRSARIFRTGDRARWLPDCGIEWLGRMDRQVQVMGCRIEPAEIEAALLQFPRVREAFVVAREDADGERRLVAYLTSYQNTTVSINELRRFVRNRLPACMLPSAFVVLDQLPLTADGQVNRRTLRAPEEPQPESDSGFDAPRAGLEQALAAIWEDVLSVRHAGANDNFFDLGGNSLQLLEVRHRLQQSLGLCPPLIRFFEYPTLRALADHLLGGGEGKKEEPLHQRILERTRRQQALALPRKLFGARVRL